MATKISPHQNKRLLVRRIALYTISLLACLFATLIFAPVTFIESWYAQDQRNVYFEGKLIDGFGRSRIGSITYAHGETFDQTTYDGRSFVEFRQSGKKKRAYGWQLRVRYDRITKVVTMILE